MIEKGLVTVEGRQAQANLAVSEGDRVSGDIPAPVATEVVAGGSAAPILYQDADVIVVNKPAGMVVHPAAGHESGTLVNALLHHVADLSGIGGELRPGIVHRLDKGTSGVMVVAKNDAAHEALSRQFHDREVDKEYVGAGVGRGAGRAPDRSADRARPERPAEDVGTRPAVARRR